MISKDEVKKLSELALLAVDDAELDTLTGEIDTILAYVSEIDALTAEVEEYAEPTLYNVMREDAVTNESGAYTEEILREAPDTDGKHLRVKKIL